MAVDLYLNFNGNCREAVEFYTKVFHLKQEKIMTFGEAPSDPNFPLPEEAKNLIMHTFFILQGVKLMCSDVPPGSPFIIGNNISIVIGSSDIEEMKSWFERLKEGGTVAMELQETFWSKCYGFITDKFGIGWQFSYSE